MLNINVSLCSEVLLRQWPNSLTVTSTHCRSYFVLFLVLFLVFVSCFFLVFCCFALLDRDDKGYTFCFVFHLDIPLLHSSCFISFFCISRRGDIHIHRKANIHLCFFFYKYLFTINERTNTFLWTGKGTNLKNAYAFLRPVCKPTLKVGQSSRMHTCFPIYETKHSRKMSTCFSILEMGHRERVRFFETRI